MSDDEPQVYHFIEASTKDAMNQQLQLWHKQGYVLLDTVRLDRLTGHSGYLGRTYTATMKHEDYI